MSKSPTLSSLVIALFDLARLGRTNDAELVAGRLGIEVHRVERGLAELERRGLADASRCRLTMAGLALAAQLDHAREERARWSLAA